MAGGHEDTDAFLGISRKNSSDLENLRWSDTPSQELFFST